MQPASSLGVTICALLSVLLWVAWPAFIKKIGKLRWELFFYDFLFSAFLVSLIAGLTLGTIGVEITFRDNIAIVGYRQLAYAAGAGVIFCFGAIMFVATTAIAGASIAGSLTGAVGIVFGTVIAYFTVAGLSTGVQFGGVALAIAVFAVIAKFYIEVVRLRKKDATHKTPMRKKVEAVSPGAIFALSIVGGLGFGTFLTLIDWAHGFDLPMTAFPIATLFTFGMLAVGLVLNLYFTNLPLQGDPLSPLAYFKMPLASHAPGIIAGALFAAGLACYLLMWDAPVEFLPPRGVFLGILPVAMGIFAVLGRMVWKEYDEADYRIKTVFLSGGLGLVAASLLVFVGYLGSK